MYLLARVIHQSAAEDNGQIPFVLASYLQYGPFFGIITSLRISGSFHRYPVDDNPHPLRMQRFLSVLCCALSLSLSLSLCLRVSNTCSTLNVGKSLCLLSVQYPLCCFLKDCWRVPIDAHVSLNRFTFTASLYNYITYATLQFASALRVQFLE